MPPYKSKLKITSFLDQVLCISQNESYKPWLDSPATLVNLSGKVVNDLSMPECWNWDCNQVAEWITKIVGLPQYKDCFISNYINGRHLLQVDASICPKIGIQDLSHIKRITSSITKLFWIDREKITRSISLPPRHPLTLYLLFRIPTGPRRENTTRTEFFREIGIIDPEKHNFHHWEMLNPTQPNFPCNRFGLTKRKNVYQRQEMNRQPRGNSYLCKSYLKPNHFLRIDIK